MADGLVEISNAYEIKVSTINDGQLSFDIRAKYNPSNYHPYAFYLYAEKDTGEKALLKTRRFETYPSFYTGVTFSYETPNILSDGTDLLEKYGYIETSAPHIKFTFVVQTYSDADFNDLLGESSVSASCYVFNDDYTAPEADMSLSPVCELGSFYLQGHSSVSAVFSNPREKYGSSVTGYGISVDNKNYIAEDGTDTVESDKLMTSGNITVTGTVYGEYTRIRHYKEDISVIPYAAPAVIPINGETSIICVRCDEEGNELEGGSYLTIKAGRRYSSVIYNDVKYNSCSLSFRYKSNEDSTYSEWEEILSGDEDSDEITTEALLGDMLPSVSYTVQIRAMDAVGEHGISTVIVPTEDVYMHRAGSRRALGVGKYAEEDNSVDIAEDLTLIVRGKMRFPGVSWTSLGLYEDNYDTEPAYGQSGYGCFYKLSPGADRVFILFNRVFDTTGEYRINSEALPEEYRPAREVYSICAAECSSMIARVRVDTDGIIYAYVQEDNADNTAIDWIDGHIDYWLDI